MNRRRKFLHNRMAESTLMFPVCLALAILFMAWHLWPMMSGDVLEWGSALGRVVVVMLTVFVVTETNNTFQLIRARTRSAAAIVALLLSLHPDVLATWSVSVPALLISISYALIFHCYQQREAPGLFFYATLSLSLSSLFAPMLLLLLPCYVFYQAVHMRAISQRTFLAGLMGAALPYLFWMLGSFLLDAPFSFTFGMSMEECWQGCLWNKPFSSPIYKIVWGCFGYYSLVGLIHYWGANYTDKIRTRQMCYIYVYQSVLINLLIMADPSHVEVYASLLAVSSAPLLGHYLTLTRTRFALFQTVCCFFLYLYLLSVVWVC